MLNLNKRYATKWVRDRAKAAYQKQNCCKICGSTESLELHHYASVTQLLERWARANKLDISTDEGIIAVRDEFIEAHQKELYEDVVTLCKKHHQLLHKVYGAKPIISTASKQSLWVERQMEKANGN